MTEEAESKPESISKASGFIALFCILVLASLFLLNPPGTSLDGKVAIKEAIQPAFGQLYKVKLPLVLDLSNPKHPVPKFRLFEDTGELGPGQASIPQIVQQGRGAYTYLNGELHFSSSDGSNPMTNGRTYSIQGKVKLFPPFLYLIVLILIYILTLFAASRIIPTHLKARKWLIPVVNLFVLIFVLEACFWTLTRTQLARSSDKLYNFYAACFHDGNLVTSAGGAMNFAPHKTLPYAINGQASYYGEKQYNGDYKIRRKEPIRPRDQVSWRALALGGSTTFDEAVPREEYTWVYQLEKLIRGVAGPNVDVINGGVMGYTLLDNIAHYEAHLKDLKPDTVILFVGINDIHPRFVGTLKADYSNYRKGWTDLSKVLPEPNRILSKTWFYRFIILRTRLTHMIQSMHIGELVNHPMPKDPADMEAGLNRNSAKVFEDRLSAFVASLKAEGKQVILVPQVILARGPNAHPRAQQVDALYVRANTEHNAASARVAAAHQVPYNQGLPGLITRQDLADNSHYNYQGSKKMADSLFQFMNAQRLLPEKN